jgi:hypothetical protein
MLFVFFAGALPHQSLGSDRPPKVPPFLVYSFTAGDDEKSNASLILI